MNLLFVYLHRIKTKAGVVKLVDTLDLGSSAARCVGSSPSTRTNRIRKKSASCRIAELAS